MVTEFNYTWQAIAQVRSPLKEKFGLPRQSNLIADLKGKIEILSPYDRDEAFKGLSGYSHIWIISVFHQALREQWKATVRPPRLGGNERVGVFSSRAPYRPNPIGLSVCRLHGIERQNGRLVLMVSGCDLVDATPVLDIKPYLPYTDCISDSRAGFAEALPLEQLSVCWSEHALNQLESAVQAYPDLRELIKQLIAFDPRPAYQHSTSDREYGMHVYDFNIRFCVDGQKATVIAIDPV